MVAEAVERVNLNRRRLFQLSGASLAAAGLHVALSQAALAQVPDPAGEVPELFIIDGLTEAANDPDVQQYIRTGALPFWIAGMFVNVWRTNLDFISMPQELADYYRRAGAAHRDRAGPQAIWETIPREVRMAGPQALQEFHSSRDWSHFIPQSLGGDDSDDSDNSNNKGIFEDSVLNQVGGPAPMTPEEIEAIRVAVTSIEVRNTIRLTAPKIVIPGLIGAAIGGVFAVMEYGLQYHKGRLIGRNSTTWYGKS